MFEIILNSNEFAKNIKGLENRKHLNFGHGPKPHRRPTLPYPSLPHAQPKWPSELAPDAVAVRPPGSPCQIAWV
jgi:hypothetical protein